MQKIVEAEVPNSLDMALAGESCANRRGFVGKDEGVVLAVGELFPRLALNYG